jgi:outer membrane protein OmpA-like peptidoglycan-associated protein
MKLLTSVCVLAAAAFMVSATGCADNKLSARVDGLTAQNKELDNQLKLEREARMTAEAKLAAAPTTPIAAETGVPGMGPLDLTTPLGGRIGATPSKTTPVKASTPAKATVATKVTLPGTVLFDSGKVSLNAAAKKTLDTMAATIKSKHAGEKLVIEGYTDSTPPSKTSVWKSNADLALARAQAVKTYLTSKKGIAAADISLKAMTTMGTGASSRRAEVAVLASK